MATTCFNLISIIEFVLKILLESLIYLSYSITIFAFYFNILLQVYYQSFIEKLKQHKASFEDSIKRYIKQIKDDLTKPGSTLTRFRKKINNIESEITNFSNNYAKIGHISGYNDLKSIIKDRSVVGDIGTIYEIFRTLLNYENALREFNKHKPKLFNFINLLKSYSQEILKIEKSNSDKLSDYSRTAHRTLQSLNDLKIYIDEFNKYIKKAKLQEICNHIKTLKSLVNEVLDKINPHLKDHIQSLVNIDFDYNEFDGSITIIKKFTDAFIKKFNNARNAIALYRSLESETSKLTGVQFSKYDINELIKNSNEIKRKLESFETINLTPTTSTTSGSDDSVPEIKETHEQYSSDISSYQSLIKYLLNEISVLINTYYLILIIKSYTAKISEMRTKINKMDDIEKALKELPEIVKDLTAFYRVNNSSMNILIVFHSISFSRYYINKYILNFIMVNYYCEVLIFSMLCYYLILYHLIFLEDLLKDISKLPDLTSATREIKILRAFTTNTNRYLQSIMCNIESLKSLGDSLSIDNLKYSLAKIRTTIDKISEETNHVKNNMKFINKLVTQLIIINFKIIYVKKYINIIIKKIISFIGYIYIYYLMFNLYRAKRYTKKDPDLTVLFESNSIFNIIENLQKLQKIITNNEDIYKGFIENFIINLVSVTNNINKLTGEIHSYNKIIDKSVKEVECAIEGVPRNLIRCSLLSTTNNTTVIEYNLLDKQMVSMYSVLNVMDYKVVVNRLYGSAKKIDQILQLVPWPDGCKCLIRFERSINNRIILHDIYFTIIIDNLSKISKDQLDSWLKLDKISKIHELGISDNHKCLCMILKYLLYPAIIKLIDIMAVDLDALGTISRKFQKYSDLTGLEINITKLLLLVIGILEPISKWVKNNYTYATIVHTYKIEIKCFCCYHEDSKYHLILNTVLVISSLLENIWSMDPETMKMGIEKISTLIRDFDMIDSQNNKGICNNNIYWLLVNKKCKAEAPEKCCCCCWCPEAVNVLMMCISLSFQCKLCKALCNNSKASNGCEKVKNFCEVVDCDCQCTVPNQGVCCVLQSAFYIYLTNAKGEDCKTLKELLGECSTQCRVNGCCAKLKEKLDKGLCKLLLLGCECNCTTAGTASELKVKCVFFNNPWGCTSVSVVVFCKCKPPKECCCLYQLIVKLEGKLKSWSENICQDTKCVCDELKIPDDICGTDCEDGCVCKTLKTEIGKLCGNAGGECLCKLIKVTISKVCSKGTCPCSKPGNICCRCCCCKILRESVRILARACRQNVLEAYKRIVTDLVCSDKYKPQLLRSIVNGINNGTINRIYLVKNNFTSGSYPDSNIGLKDISSVRNWGYDTLYEHHVTTDQSIKQNEGYPNIDSPIFLNSHCSLFTF